ncbi:exopolysaccharide biosynthesis protein [Thalassospira indica]|uniref:Exopolysaccharide biosynthesis protein n=1 Tax=Thalassospira indica TaxID=1891279 RepID=A0ABM6Y4U3_9PROT|nr:exopolysaccharide biosynthesis protein [Thalassospira indica]AXO16937.1 exopolysaccharide biosynthesis protein [Thalassospira indica]OAZ14046.1 membrane protein [Thalassospira profundimaris]
MTKPKNASVEDIVARIGDRAAKDNRVSVGDIVAELGQRSQGPFLLVPALIGVSPIGGIPFAPTFLAALVAVFSLQIIIGRTHLWLPDFLAEREISGDKVRTGLEKIDPVAKRMDRWFGGRFESLISGVAVRIAALMCLILSLSMPMFELVPFAAIAPMSAIAAFGLAILVSDGLLMLAALGMTLGTVILMFQII